MAVARLCFICGLVMARLKVFSELLAAIVDVVKQVVDGGRLPASGRP